jgi:hypothetical protein
MSAAGTHCGREASVRTRSESRREQGQSSRAANSRKKSEPSSTSSPLAVSPVLAVLERRQSDGRRQTCGPPLGPEKERDRAEEQKVSDTSASSSAE